MLKGSDPHDWTYQFYHIFRILIDVDMNYNDAVMVVEYS